MNFSVRALAALIIAFAVSGCAPPPPPPVIYAPPAKKVDAKTQLENHG